jgi:hypothetical protein
MLTEKCECHRTRIRLPRGMEGALLEMAGRAEVLLVYVCVVDSLVLALALVLVLVEMCGCRADGVPVLVNAPRGAPRGAPRNVAALQHASAQALHRPGSAADGQWRRLSRSEPMLSSAWPEEVTPQEVTPQEVTPQPAPRRPPAGASAARMRANAREAPPTPGSPGLPPSCARWRAEQGGVVQSLERPHTLAY